jgi:DNA polymerase-3 subunit delta'
MSALLAPRLRANHFGREGLEAQIAASIEAGALANGWLITGGEGAGKATLAFRIARRLLDRNRGREGRNLDVAADSEAFALVASGGHPDLFVAERRFDEKKDAYDANISVETVRELTHFLQMTAAMGGWRVVIVDTADDLNRSSQNALLKSLEEPPPRTSILLLSAAPGRLPATIRSRCRRIDLPALSDAEVADFLVREGAADAAAAARIAGIAKGRPGFALQLANGAGVEALDEVEAFMALAERRADVSPVAQRLSSKSMEDAFHLFASLLVGGLEDRARKAALRGEGERATLCVSARDQVSELFRRGDALNIDRTQMILSAARMIARAASP